MIRLRGTIMTTIKAHLLSCELEARYKGAADAIAKSHFHALWLSSLGYEVDESAELLSFSPRWVRALIKRYNEGGAEMLGDQRIHNGTKPTILTPDALTALRERIKMPVGFGADRRLRAGLPSFMGARLSMISAHGTL